MTDAEAAAFLRLGGNWRAALARYRAMGLLRAFQIGNDYRYTPEALMEFVHGKEVR